MLFLLSQGCKSVLSNSLPFGYSLLSKRESIVFLLLLFEEEVDSSALAVEDGGVECFACVFFRTPSVASASRPSSRRTIFIILSNSLCFSFLCWRCTVSTTPSNREPSHRTPLLSLSCRAPSMQAFSRGWGTRCCGKAAHRTRWCRCTRQSSL